MAWLSRHWKLILAIGIALLLGGGIIAVGTMTGMIENKVNLQGETGLAFSTKTWNPFPPLRLDEGDEATFYIEMRPNSSLTEWGFFLYIMNSTGQSLKTISRGSAFGGAERNIRIPFTAPYTDTYLIRAYASSAPANSLQIYSSVSILESGPNMIVLTVGIAFFVVGTILLSISLLKKPEKTAKVS